MAYQETPKQHIKKCSDGILKPDNLTLQDMPKEHPIKINNKNNKSIQNEFSQSDDAARTFCINEETDDQFLERIYSQCEIHIWDEEVGQVFQNAIDRLYYSESFKIDKAILPQSKIRSCLNLIDSGVLVEVYNGLRALGDKLIRNKTQYIMAMIINGIFEKGEVMIELMPPSFEFGGAG